MKARIRVLSLLLALLMLLSLAPELKLHAAAAPADPTAKAPPVPADPAAVPTDPAQPQEDDTDLTIDFNYEKEHNVKSREEALRLTVDSQYHYTEVESKSELDAMFVKTIGGKQADFHWKKCSSWTVHDHDIGSLRELLCSTDPDDKYIALNYDDEHNFTSGKTKWVTMEIRKDKVLDLNGHQIKIRYDANRDDDGSQRDETVYHNCVAFRILDGATLTIIDSSAWRGEGEDGQGTGLISFTAWRVNPFEHKINTYTTRDLFDVAEGNLVIYGGHFQAGNQRTFYKSNFSWSKLRETIGTAVELGVSVAEYATGIDVASSKYKDLLISEKSTDVDNNHEDSDDDDDGSDSPSTTRKKDGSDAPKEDAKDSPVGKDTALKTVDEKQAGKTDGDENRANEKKTGKDDKNTKLANGRKDIVNSAVSKDGVMGMVGKVFDLGEQIAGMVGKDKDSFCVEYILGTVVKVGNGSTFVAYGGHFEGYGSTPNTRNAVVEMVYNPGTVSAFDSSKVKGGYAYIYGGTFEGFGGANIFNFVRSKLGSQFTSQIVVEPDGSRPTEVVDGETIDKKSTVELTEAETGGVEILYYDNQAQAGTPGFEPKLINTANVQVRGGVFRNHYETQNVAIRQPEDKDNFTRFPGTNGWINLGIESFGENLIRDGRIQIVDKYHDGALVLLDKQSQERADAIAAGEEYTEGLYRYRLLCGDEELRAKSYLEVHPNTDAKTNSAKSMQLASYGGAGEPVSRLWTDDKYGDNIRAPERKTENYFDFVFDNYPSNKNYSIMPMFHDPDSTDPKYPEFSQWTTSLSTSEFWYYPTPMMKQPEQDAMVPMPKVTWYNALYYGLWEDTDNFAQVEQMTCEDKRYIEVYDPHEDGGTKWIWTGSDEWSTMINHITNPSFLFYQGDDLKTTQRYFTYKVYRVDPLTRDNIIESNVYGEDSPLISVRYGASDDSLKCKLPLLDVEQQIKARQIAEGVPESKRWKGFQSGELYRVTLCVEEDLVFGGYYETDDGVKFRCQLPTATCESSIVFRCLSLADLTAENPTDVQAKHDFTPLQWRYEPEGGMYAWIDLLNGKAGMTDYKHDNKVFDVYYQWWETDKDGNPLQMIAGTDNVFTGTTQAERQLHDPHEWIIENDHVHTYVNTVNPNDPNAASYTYHGLPGDENGKPLNKTWTAGQLHMYTAQTVDKDSLRLGPGNLSPKNNNVYATNYDSCYIPTEMSGKYLRAKAIVLNPEWKDYFDAKQTFWSHTMQIKAPDIFTGVSLNRYTATAGKATEVFVNGIAGQLPVEQDPTMRFQWQRKTELPNAEWENISGAIQRSFTIPANLPTGQNNYPYIFYRVAITSDKFIGTYYSGPCTVVEYEKLSCPSVSIPQGPTGQKMEGINLGLLLEGGSGVAYFQKSEGPAWITVDSNGYLWGTRPSNPQDQTTLKVLATDEVHPELQLLISIPVGRVYKALSGELVLEGNAWYSGSNVSPNVLTAAFLSINAPSPDDLTYFWYRNNKLVKSGKGASTYPIYNIDDKCVIKCEVTADGMVGHLSASVTLGLAPGPAAPEVQLHAYAGWDGNPTGYIEVINGEYPLELSTSASFASPLATIQEGNFLNLSLGTYYVRCAATSFRSAGAYRKVTLSAANALTILPRADKIPWGTYGTATSEDREYEYLIEVVGGTPPFDFEIYDGPWPEALQYNEATYDRTGAYCTIYKKQDDVPIPRNSRYAYITGRYPNEGYGNFGRVTVMVTDGNGDRAYQQFFFEGWDHDTETENFADLGIVHDFPELTYGYVPGEDTEAIVYMINRGCNEIDKTQLSYRVTYPEYDDTEGFIEVDVTDWFEFYTIKNSDTIPRATYDEVHIRAKAGIRPDFHVLNFYIDGINGEYEGQNKKELSLKVNPISLAKCTVEPVPDLVYDGTWQEPEIVIRDGNGIQLVQNDDFYVSYRFNRDVGTAEWTATALNESSYAPYIGSISGTFEILKAGAEDREVELYAPSNWNKQLEFDLYNHIPVYYGLQSLELLSVSDPLGLLKPGSVSNDFNLLRLTPSGVDSQGCECSVTFLAKCRQVEDFELNVVICFSGGEEPILNVKPYAKTYDGEPVRIEDLNLSATVDGVPVAGQWSFAAPDDDLLLVNAHSTEEVLLRFQPEDTDAYMPVYEYLELTIWQAPVTGEPVWALEEAKMAAWPLWKFHLSAEGGSFSVPGHVEWEEPGQNVQPNVAYEWTFYPDNQSYEYHTGYIVLWPRDKKAPTLHVENYQKYYDGKTVTVNDITKSATYNGKAVPGSWSFPNVTDDEELTVKMDNWGRYEKIIRFTPSSSEYCTVDARLWLEIKPGRVTGEPNYTRIYEAGHTLADVELSEFGGSFNTAGHVSFDVSDDSPVLLDIPYNWTFYPDDDNYDPLYGSLVPWRSKEPVELTVQPFTKTYDSKRVTVDQLTKTAKYEGKAVSGSWSFVRPNDPLLTNAHAQEPVMLRFTPSDSKLAVTDVQLLLTINPVSVTGAPAFTPIKISGKTLEDTKLRTAGGSFPVSGIVYYDLPEDTAVEPNKAYTWYFVPSSSNYTYTSGTVVPWNAPNPFVDVKEGKYYYKPVLWAYYHEPQITGGSDATHFSPGKTCTREQIVTFLWKACGAPAPEGSVSPFTDVKTSKYYFKPVMWAVENGITGGVGDGTKFGVGQPCTREQAMTFLWKAVGSPAPETTVSPFSDVKTGKYYFKPVLWAVENGITGGVGDGKFGVGRPCTRGQIVTFLYAAAGDQE